MPAKTDDVRLALEQLAAALVDDLERIAQRTVTRMQELLPSYAKVPTETLIPVTLTHLRNLLQAVVDPEADPSRAEDEFRIWGETGVSRGVTADDLLQAWRIGAQCVRQEAQTVARHLGIPDEVLLKFVEATVLWGDVGMRMSVEAQRDVEVREFEGLAAEHAALRRVAMLVADGVESGAVFAAVADEVHSLFGADMSAIVRFDEGRSVALLGAHGGAHAPGARVGLDPGYVVDSVRTSGRAARFDTDDPRAEEMPGVVRALGIRSALASPIIVDGQLWGAVTAATSGTEPMPADAESRIAQFTELVATAVSNVHARTEVERLVAEQTALRRVATMVARTESSEEVFAQVAEEAGLLLEADSAGVCRYERDDRATLVAAWGQLGRTIPVGSRFGLDDHDSVPALIYRTKRPARVVGNEDATGAVGDYAREVGLLSACGAPIFVGGRLWGSLVVGSSRRDAMLADAESRMAEFTELAATAISNIQARSEVEDLAEEQAALRRVAELVAHEASQTEIFTAIAEEIGRLLGTGEMRMMRYESDRAAVIVASAGELDIFPVGSRWSLDGENVASRVYHTRQPARIDEYAAKSGPIADGVQSVGIRGVVGSPILVGGQVWGAMLTATVTEEPLPSDTGRRLGQFTELMATAIANAEARAEVERLAEEQAALRRVATLVARGVSPDEIFSAVSDEVGRLFRSSCSIARFEPEGSAMVVVGVNRGAAPVSLGTRWELEDFLASTAVYHTGRSARRTHTGDINASGRVADSLRAMGFVSTVAAPIVVDGRPWGAITVSDHREDLPPDTEERVESFTELVATAIASAQGRAELAASEGRARDLAREQAALRRVATLVAEGVSAEQLFSAVSLEAAEVIRVPVVGVHRYEADATFTTMGVSGETSFSVSSRWPIEKGGLADMILATGRPARKDDYARMPGALGAAVRRDRMLSTVGVPIVVDGSVWGFMVAAATPGTPLPGQTEERFARFIELVATAIANSQARAHLEQLAEEQAALRRVATLVAEGASATAVFDAVAAGMERVLGADGVTLSRYEPHDEAIVLAHSGSDPRRVPPGTRVSHRGENVTSLVRSGMGSARMEHRGGPPGAIAELASTKGVRVSVGAPIVVDGRLWGVAIANWSSEKSPPADTEERMAKFAELLDTAIANADSRDQLTASRARLLTEADEARRRVVRDLHDGAQQRLVHTIVTLKLAQRALQRNDGKAESHISEALEQAQQGNAELRELAHGILPAVLTQGGLRSGVNSIVSRLELPIEVDIPANRFPAEIEASAYFVVAEALTNVVKHSHAGRAEVRARVNDGTLHVEVSDNGVGHPDLHGHGLVGLADRVIALGGRLEVSSPPNGGTLLSATLPLSAG
jgi:GAF domain-containing protein